MRPSQPLRAACGARAARLWTTRGGHPGLWSAPDPGGGSRTRG
ncbi:hypothetical protein [Cellulosimicrobium funkei]|nr:hypothetical protein [Cellulosimicrobium funkei]